jgi:hypothetical protein
VVEEVSETAVDGWVSYVVVIVQHNEVFCSRIDQSVDEDCNPRSAIRSFRGMQVVQRLRSYAGRDLVQG